MLKVQKAVTKHMASDDTVCEQLGIATNEKVCVQLKFDD